MKPEGASPWYSMMEHAQCMPSLCIASFHLHKGERWRWNSCRSFPFLWGLLCNTRFQTWRALWNIETIHHCILLYFGSVVSPSDPRFQPWFRPWDQLSAVVHSRSFAIHPEWIWYFPRKRNSKSRCFSENLLALFSQGFLLPTAFSNKNCSSNSETFNLVRVARKI